MKSTKKIFFTMALLVLAASGYYYYRQTHQPKAEDIYRLEQVTVGDIEQNVSANGTLNPVTIVSVGTQVSGIVKKLYVDFNDVVKKDQILLELDNSLFMAQISQSQATVRNVQATVELAQANEARFRNLYGQEFVSKQELDTAVQVLKSAKAQLDSARGQVARDRTNLDFTVIRSPVSGVVVDRVVDVGQTVASSFQTPTLIKIAQDLAKMQIDSSFAEADIGNIKVGQAAKFNVDAYPNRDFTGVVKQVRLNPTNTSNVVIYNVVISVDNTNQLLLPGMTAYVNIAVAKRDQVLLIPNAALRYKPKVDDNPSSKSASDANKKTNKKRNKAEDLMMAKIYLLKNGKPALLRVKVGITDGRRTEVSANDLNVNDTVIIGDARSDDTKPAATNGPRSSRMF